MAIGFRYAHCFLTRGVIDVSNLLNLNLNNVLVINFTMVCFHVYGR